MMPLAGSNPGMLLIRFIRQREGMRRAKDLGMDKKFWTEDEILLRYRFCNVRRRDDRVSRWLLGRYYPKFFAGTDDVWFAAAVARLINWPPTLKFLYDAGAIPSNLIHYDPKNFAGALANFHQISPKTYTGAYMLYAGGRNPKYKGVPKHDFIAHHVLIDLFDKRIALRAALKKRSVRLFSEALQGCFSFSSFMAGQVAANLTYLPGQLAGADDLYTYAPQGPGSVRGLNRLLGRPLSDRWEQQAFEQELIRVRTLLVLPSCGFPDGIVPTLHDVQNVMCEYDKYVRVLGGEGAPRSLYVPETAYEV